MDADDAEVVVIVDDTDDVLYLIITIPEPPAPEGFPSVSFP
jgi:hypothetical protein